jgi:hypothetical protein
MFIPDPGSQFFHPGSGSETKTLSNFIPTNCYKALGNTIRDVYPGSPGSGFFFHPGGSATLLLTRVRFSEFFIAVVPVDINLRFFLLYPVD